MAELYMNTMDTNIVDLRKQAYRHWGISPRNVIFNMPISNDDEFSFKLDCSSELKSWPKSYVISLPHKKTLNRIIMPVFVIQKYADTEVTFPAWYDMPEELNVKIIELLKTPHHVTLPWWKRAFNVILPKKLRYLSQMGAEDYVFKVYNHDPHRLVITIA